MIVLPPSSLGACFPWLPLLRENDIFMYKEVFGFFGMYIYEWWPKQYPFIPPLFLYSSLKCEVTYCRQVSTYPPSAWPPELITSHIPWWFCRDWKLGSGVCYARELIKNFIARGKLIYSSLFVLYFNHLSWSQKGNCLLHISNRCWGIEKVSRIHINKKAGSLSSREGSEPIKTLLLTCLSSPLKYLTFI